MAISDDVAAFSDERRYAPATLERWLRLNETDARGLLSLAASLRLSDNQLRDVWQWAEEIAQRDQRSLAEVLGAPALVALQARPLGRSDKIKLLKAELRRLRFPELVAGEQRAADLVAALALPRHVRALLPANLNADAIEFTVLATSPESLRAGAAALLAGAARIECAQLFALLAEAP